MLRAYLVAVGLHTLWNGGFAALLYLIGLNEYGQPGPELALYGEPLPLALVVFLGLLAVFLWWLLFRMLKPLSENVASDPAPVVISPRSLAGWALTTALVLAPLGALIGSRLR